NLTPMIDVVFLMIVFFMLVAELTRARALEIEPPREAGVEAAEDGTLLIQVDSDGMRALAGERWYALDDAGLGALTERLAGLDRVRLRADRGASYGAPGAVLNAARDAGVRRVELVVETDG
ncbi:MAG: biopolymer transporter ExbD, partial [Planctomycetota bacterium]